MINDRQSYRLRKQFDLAWSFPEQKMQGEGIIFNISLSGMLFVSDRLFDPERFQDICFSVAGVPSFPLKGTLVWFRKVGKDESQYQCGVRFLDEYRHNSLWIKWMEENISKLADAEDSRILDHFLNEGQP